MSVDAPLVAVFDSGLGGLSVLGAIRQTLPTVRCVYVADTAAFPYGIKREADLIARVQRVLPPLLKRCRPDLLVVACNTASTIALPHIRAALGIPVVGVVPAIKPAAAGSETGVIGLLATPGTASRRYTDGLIAEFAAQCEVIRVGNSRLVELAEAHVHGEPASMEELAAILAPFHEHPAGARLDTVVLACTHFPLLANELAVAFGRPVRWVDSGQAIANRVAQLLGDAARIDAPAHTADALFTGGNVPTGHRLKPYGIGRIDLLDT